MAKVVVDALFVSISLGATRIGERANGAEGLHPYEVSYTCNYDYGFQSARVSSFK